MDNNSPQPSFELPPMPGEPAAQQGEDGRYEAAPISERAAAPPPLTSAPVQPVVPIQAPTASPLQPPAAASADPRATASPDSADDNDLIEKEWVVKAKQIVAATREDPHTQNKELSKFKADYLKKRYGKDIRVEDS